MSELSEIEVSEFSEPTEVSGVNIPQSGRKPVKRACTNCRQQKARCDVWLDPNGVCSRCRKLHKRCVVSEPFRRETKRKRTSEPELSIDGSRRSSSQPARPPLPEHSWTAVNNNQPSESDSRLASVAPFFRDATIAPVSFRSFSQALESVQTPASLPREQQAPAPLPLAPSTLPRSLEGYTIDSKDIDAIFQIYFRDYAGFMPILDPSITPNAYYGLSRLLFWAIIGVGCRTYYRNPTLLGVLPAKIKTLALLTMDSNVTLPNLQAYLLILCWPFPKTTNSPDFTFPFSAAVLHMAMAMGLHLPVASQEFSKVRIRLSEDESKKRAETWGYCMLVYQRSCHCKGSPATPIVDIPHDLEQRRTLFQQMSAMLKFELKLQDVITRCCIALSQNGLRVMTPDQERSLDTLLNLFQAQAASVVLEYATALEHLYVQIATLTIQSFNLYKSPKSQDPTSLYDLCASSCQVIESFDSLDKAGKISLAASTVYFYYSIMVPCHILLRLLKTSFSRYINVERAKSALFLGIGLHKRMSIQNDDLPARNGVALTQLWNSNRAFQNANGTEAVALRIRSRLCGSILLDGIVWWREEFGGFMGVYPPPLTEQEGTSASATETLHDNMVPPTTSKLDYSSFLDDPMLAEFGLAISDDIFSTMWTDNDGNAETV
ncbi:hypothetical protein HRR83_003346 [Exophiala dermatitidis]|nr:hypothetical protein HRR77_002002 [Exophiala dermatitidis]KAJ4580398.1 hypothetical protein HRR81_002562 [Exophiala dermatitidis]KAJ4600286.1 hypothetical protein HRR83_003346 [Exophiala dermatitidis]KAJ4614947.1 hypothetical protein HRR85_003726 [Exophiala dermatitidis]KAJ4681797.1 hypothetical protein HRR92_002514 [Exophiala dermatitidis]